MEIRGLANQYPNYNNIISNIKGENNIFNGALQKNARETDVQEEGDVIGIAMITEPNTICSWGMKAKFATDSTEDNPIIYVETNYKNQPKAYKISINDIDPNNATKLEMFALCSYADQMGMGDKSTFGTYQTLLGFEKMSIHNGFFNGKVVEEPAWDMFISAKLDWENAFYKVKDLLYKCNDLGQYSKSLSILDLFSKYPVK